MLNATLSKPALAQAKTQISAQDIPNILDHYADKIKILSLDCFDTLLWRHTHAPKDVFTALAQKPIAKQFGFSATQRISAAAQAYRYQFVSKNSQQIHLQNIYQRFTALSSEQQAALAQEELQTEIEMCFAFKPFVDLIKQAHALGIKIIIVSDIYLKSQELKNLLQHHLHQDVMNMISHIYTSFDFGLAKSHGLFDLIIKQLNIPGSSILHIGDHEQADFHSAKKASLNALQFLQFDTKILNFFKLQQAANSLTTLAKTNASELHQVRFNPFKAVIASADIKPYPPETMIGYLSFGPIMYAYARFLTDEVKALQDQGKCVKVCFLLRDAYLLSRACEAYTRKPLGKLVRIRKFVAVAASFKTIADIDYYISGIKPEHYHFNVITDQLLLPQNIAAQIIQLANNTHNPQASFHELLHQATITDIIFKNSATYRENLKRYMLKEMDLQAGDTLVLADTGFVGVTQDYLQRTFAKELNIEITGRYLLSSHEPDKPQCKSLITTTWCDHSLLEQSCTYKEGAVADYDDQGNPIFENIKLSDEQYKKVSALQAECIRFIHDAKTFFSQSNIHHDFAMLQQTAHAALLRHIYLPLEEELTYFKNFQHDKDMGHDLKKTVYNIAQAQELAKRLPSPYQFNAYEMRAISTDLSLSALIQRGFDLELNAEDMTIRSTPVSLILANHQESAQHLLMAKHLHDGYYSLILPHIQGTRFTLAWGQHYQWLQIDKIALLSQGSLLIEDMKPHTLMEDIQDHGALLQCISPKANLQIKAITLQQVIPCYYRIVFRPLT